MYVQFSSDVGGALIYGLYPIVAGLDRDRYEPSVLFYWSNPYRERFEALGVETTVFEKPRPWRHPAPITGIQKNRMVRGLQTRNDRRGNSLYHALGSYVRLSYYIPQIVHLAKHMRASNIELVHLNSSPAGHGREVVLAAKLVGVPCVSHVQGFCEFQAADRLVARLVDRYIYCSEAVGRHCVTQCGIEPTKGQRVYYGLPDLVKWSQPNDTPHVRRELGWSNEDFVVGNIGRLVPWKGQDVFLKALAEVKRVLPEIKGLIVGGPDSSSEGRSFYEHLLALAQSLDLVNNVHFTGFRDDIPRIMASVDVVVHSSSSPEPLGMVIAEGMVAGRPVIATNAGGVTEIVEDGVTGMLVSPNDPQAMGRAILSLYRDPALAERVATTGQQKAKEQFDTQRYVDEIEAIYEALLV